ncbi:uncharacterized protein TNCV_4027011 [Trichonephila clavipes]|nr:uncharacterized protein TNCV_4027011 [Trichonephila clavipes]
MPLSRMENTTFAIPSIIDSHELGLRTVLQSGCPKENAYSKLLDDWNVDVQSWKYSRNLESPRVSSPGFGNDSKMMLMGVDVTAQVTPELQRRMRTGIRQLLPKETDGAQHHTYLFGYRYDSFKADRVQTLRAH